MEGEDRRYRLARLHQERMNYTPEKGWGGGVRRSRDRWGRFMAGSGWEKLFAAGVIVLIAALAIGGLFVLASNMSGGSKKQAAAGSSKRSTPTATRAPRTTPTPIVINVPVLPTPEPTDRRDCDSLRNQDFKNDAERTYYEENCKTPTPEPTATPTRTSPGQGLTTQPPPPPPPPPTQPPPPTPDTFTAGDAINIAAYWMTNNAGYQNPYGCNAYNSGGHWVVTCNVTGPSPGSVSVCVFTDPLVVRPSNQC